MELCKFIEIQPSFYSIELGFVRSFLFIGQEELLLIDTGIGGQQLKRQIKERFDVSDDKQIKVVFTHGDRDHIGDAGDFNIRFMSPLEMAYYEAKAETPVSMMPINEGDRIIIGDFILEVIDIPGHTPGSIGLIEHQHRFMIGGDSIQTGPIFMFGEGRDFNRYKHSLLKLENVLDKIDWIFASHHELKVPTKILQQLIIGTDKMLASEIEGVPEARFENKVKIFRTDGISFFAL